MSQRRSLSVRGALLAVEEFDDVGRAVHDWTVERTEVYLAS